MSLPKASSFPPVQTVTWLASCVLEIGLNGGWTQHVLLCQPSAAMPGCCKLTAYPDTCLVLHWLVRLQMGMLLR